MYQQLLIKLYLRVAPFYFSSQVVWISVLNSDVILSVHLYCFILHWSTKIRSGFCEGFRHAVCCWWINSIGYSAQTQVCAATLAVQRCWSVLKWFSL